MKKTLLFMIPNLKHGGAEKVLVNLVNNLNPEKYEITVQTLFDVGIHKASLRPHIQYRSVFKREFRGNNRFLQLFSPEFLWKNIVKEHYDIAISYLEGPTTRIVSGCADPQTKKICWVHTEMTSPEIALIGFRNIAEARILYSRFDRIVGVSRKVSQQISSKLQSSKTVITLYNTNETEQIIQLSNSPLCDSRFKSEGLVVCSVGKLMNVKGFDRLINAHKRLLDEGFLHRIYILGIGKEHRSLDQKIKEYGIEDSFILLGFKDNPYQYVSRCDLYVCSSRREGFSTAVTEALIVGTPVVSTDCSGAKELLGEHDEYGLVVENSEQGVYQGMKRMLSDPSLLAHYKEKAKERGSFFSREQTVTSVEEMLDSLIMI